MTGAVIILEMALQCSTGQSGGRQLGEDDLNSAAGAAAATGAAADAH